MTTVLRVDPAWSLACWRAQARAALQARVPPESVHWQAGAESSLFAPEAVATPDVEGEAGAGSGPAGGDVAPMPADARVPRAFLSLVECLLCHRGPWRHALPYRMLWRLARGERHLLEVATDPDTRKAALLAADVRRDSHKMKAFVRFRAVPGTEDHYLAWFEPQHDILDRVAPFFARRFAGMHWGILTPGRSVWWDRRELRFGPGAMRSEAPADDAAEVLWQTYYAHIFNPARLNPRMMRQEMPQRYWKHLPEAQLLPQLLRSAGSRVRDMVERAPQPPRRRIPPRLKF